MLICESILAACDVIAAIKAADVLPISSAAIAARYDFKRRRLESLLQRMSNLNIITSKRGPSGGYDLTKHGRNLSFFGLVQDLAPVGDQWLLTICVNWKYVEPEEVSRKRHRSPLLDQSDCLARMAVAHAG